MAPIVCPKVPPPAATTPPPPPANAPPPPLPAGCAPYGTTGDKTVSCFLTLEAGFTYSIFTECSSVRGDTKLALFDEYGKEVAFDDDYPFCPADVTASLIEYFVPVRGGCGERPPPSQAF